MKISLPLALTAVLLVAACSKTPVENAQAPAAQDPSVHSYVCKSGETVLAGYPSTETATIAYKDRTHDLQIAVSASGARYVGDGFEWWTKGSGAGSEATLLRHLPDGTSGEVLESCTRS